jgi:hypothetical protein
MAACRHALFVVVAVLPALGASYRTANFAVEAPTPQLAKQVALAAEKYRQAIARLWLGREMPDWPEPCLLNVEGTFAERRGGYSTFYFDRGKVSHQQVNVKGPLPELLPKVLPHELTHSILAHYFGCPVPRWADEGSAILSEDDAERDRRDAQMEQLLSKTDLAYPLDELFDLNEYPRDLRAFYTESYSVTRFLIDLHDRETYLAFVAQGMRYGWDRAVRTFYPFESVEDLELAWLIHLRYTYLRRQISNLTQPAWPQALALAQGVWAATRDSLQPLRVAVGLPAVPAAKDMALAFARLGARWGRPTAAMTITSHAVKLPGE